jgi:hypothetical protein
MGGNTGLPLAIAVQLLHAGRVGRRGVLAPEAALDPREFFTAYAEMMDPPRSDPGDVLAVLEKTL